MVRAHVVIERELVEEVDELVGPRQRSKFFADAVREKLARAKTMDAARKAAGALAEVEVPGWETSEAAASWVRTSRRADSDRLGPIAGE